MTPALALSERVALAQSIIGLKREVAAEVTDEFFRRYPEWRERYGAIGLQRGLEDAGYHVEYLAAAVETSSVQLFEQYARWTSRVLESRGISSRFVVENLGQVEASLRSRLGPDAMGVVARYIAAAASAASEPPPPEPAAEPDVWRKPFLAAILGGDRAAALNICVDALSHGLSVPDLHVNVLTKALREIGEMWERNRISVADEHMATAVAQYVVAQIYAQTLLPEERRGAVIVTGVEGELHQLGANIFADILECQGWSAYFLGSNLPHPGILKKVEEHRAAAVCVSVTMPFHIPAAQRLIAAIRSRFGPQIAILLGGQAFAHAPGFYKEAGADALARDAREGASLLPKLVQGAR